WREDHPPVRRGRLRAGPRQHGDGAHLAGAEAVGDQPRQGGGGAGEGQRGAEEGVGQRGPGGAAGQPAEGAGAAARGAAPGGRDGVNLEARSASEGKAALAGASGFLASHIPSSSRSAPVNSSYASRGVSAARSDWRKPSRRNSRASRASTRRWVRSSLL